MKSLSLAVFYEASLRDQHYMAQIHAKGQMGMSIISKEAAQLRHV
ncbi:hypothetical protein [Actibacterium lipolyticum]|nr:hypothetical protein [Actibacterium lipolyticum]